MVCLQCLPVRLGLMMPVDLRVHAARPPMGDFDPSRSQSASNLQNFYATQRFQGRPNEPDQMMQAKRRMAAQRERELRNYHQEQQYNRSMDGRLPTPAVAKVASGVLADMASNKSDRSMSPGAASEEGRRELIARQHRALYGSDSAAPFLPAGGFNDEGNVPQDQGTGVPTSSASGARGNSPRGMDPFGMGQPPSQATSNDKNVQGASATQPESSRTDNSSPVGGPNSAGFGNQQGGKSSSPSGGESPSRQLPKSNTAPIGSGMAPIGSRPTQQQQQQQSTNPTINKRTTSPLPSPLGYGFGAGEQNSANNERAGSSNSNPNAQKDANSTPSMSAWGTGSGVWGSNKIGATVWG